MRDKLINLALKLVGCPYIWGGQNPWVGLDCSGFVIWIYQVFGLLPAGDWTAQRLYDFFATSRLTPDQVLLPGDLVFYGPDEKHLSHVMLALGGGMVAGASGGDHTTSTLEEARRRGAQVKVKRTGYRSDVRAYTRCDLPEE